MHRDDVTGELGSDEDSDSEEVLAIKRLLLEASDADRRSVFEWLMHDQRIHPLELEFSAPAEVILEAISRSSDLTKRGLRGVIAEAMFAVEVVDGLDGWKDVAPEGDHPYDFLLEKDQSRVSIQLKMQRKKQHRPMIASEGYRKLSDEFWVVETQRTRGGKAADGTNTRPYRFGEFDLLAVSLHPSTGNWQDYLYTVADWLLPRDDEPSQLLKFQPVPKVANEYWTDDIECAIEWLQEGTKKVISGLA